MPEPTKSMSNLQNKYDNNISKCYYSKNYFKTNSKGYYSKNAWHRYFKTNSDIHKSNNETYNKSNIESNNSYKQKKHTDLNKYTKRNDKKSNNIMTVEDNFQWKNFLIKTGMYTGNDVENPEGTQTTSNDSNYNISKIDGLLNRNIRRDLTGQYEISTEDNVTYKTMIKINKSKFDRNIVNLPDNDENCLSISDQNESNNSLKPFNYNTQKINLENQPSIESISDIPCGQGNNVKSPVMNEKYNDLFSIPSQLQLTAIPHKHSTNPVLPCSFFTPETNEAQLIENILEIKKETSNIVHRKKDILVPYNVGHINLNNINTDQSELNFKKEIISNENDFHKTIPLNLCLQTSNDKLYLEESQILLDKNLKTEMQNFNVAEMMHNDCNKNNLHTIHSSVKPNSKICSLKENISIEVPTLHSEVNDRLLDHEPSKISSQSYGRNNTICQIYDENIVDNDFLHLDKALDDNVKVNYFNISINMKKSLAGNAIAIRAILIKSLCKLNITQSNNQVDCRIKFFEDEDLKGDESYTFHNGKYFVEEMSCKNDNNSMSANPSKCIEDQLCIDKKVKRKHTIHRSHHLVEEKMQCRKCKFIPCKKHKYKQEITCKEYKEMKQDIPLKFIDKKRKEKHTIHIAHHLGEEEMQYKKPKKSKSDILSECINDQLCLDGKEKRTKRKEKHTIPIGNHLGEEEIQCKKRKKSMIENSSECMPHKKRKKSKPDVPLKCIDKKRKEKHIHIGHHPGEQETQAIDVSHHCVEDGMPRNKHKRSKIDILSECIDTQICFDKTADSRKSKYKKVSKEKLRKLVRSEVMEYVSQINNVNVECEKKKISDKKHKRKKDINDTNNITNGESYFESTRKDKKEKEKMKKITESKTEIIHTEFLHIKHKKKKKKLLS